MKALKYIIAAMFIIGGFFMLGWIFGDNETATPAFVTFLYMIIEGIFFYHYFRNRSVGNLYQ
ncbi:hypothetical protein [Lactobacillus kalixensis]|uniref:Uncharacterized protein n=1 Tax=Lactobacillus kalixensis DSM 16043 TaxID=1423763 RepID=A0A0R1UCS5_9LACO|nr:hypothetical protein FC46_GL001048 [Lactobacillus kalixensis DSM 16043]